MLISPEEFRKVFRSIDSIEHQMQLEYGGVEALSQSQRERYERQRDAAVKESLGPNATRNISPRRIPSIARRSSPPGNTARRTRPSSRSSR